MTFFEEGKDTQALHSHYIDWRVGVKLSGDAPLDVGGTWSWEKDHWGRQYGCSRGIG